jgi:hypothetical protein
VCRIVNLLRKAEAEEEPSPGTILQCQSCQKNLSQLQIADFYIFCKGWQLESLVSTERDRDLYKREGDLGFRGWFRGKV